MREKPKFTGKIRANPWVALERGNAEVMAALWREYLAELIEAAPRSGRFRVLAERIQNEARFDQLYQDWNALPPSERADRWHHLLEVSKSHALGAQAQCVRCGECCQHHSPILLTTDLPLLHDSIVSWTDIYTRRQGEMVSTATGTLTPLPSEQIKIRLRPETGYCQFYHDAPSRCLIYERRPEECRVRSCWLTEQDHPPLSGTPLTRRELFAGHPELWELLQTHERRCAFSRFDNAVKGLKNADPSAPEALFDLLHFDHYLRQMLIKDWNVPPAATELLLGRPFPHFLRYFGLKASMTDTGVFHLERDT